MNRTGLKLILEAKAILQRQVPNKELSVAQQKAVEDYMEYMKVWAALEKYTVYYSENEDKDIPQKDKEILMKLGAIGVSDDDLCKIYGKVQELGKALLEKVNKVFEDVEI